MSTNWDKDPPLKRDAESDEGEYSLSARPVQCPHCGGSRFKIGEAQLNSALTTHLKLDWIDRSATILICTTCSQIQWFGEQFSKIA